MTCAPRPTPGRRCSSSCRPPTRRGRTSRSGTGRRSSDPRWRSAGRSHEMAGNGACAHLESVTDVKKAKRRECEECVKTGSTWVHLRTCQTCGGTRCCDSSPNRHASKHARSSSHPVVASAEPGERWLYCFPDEAYGEY